MKQTTQRGMVAVFLMGILPLVTGFECNKDKQQEPTGQGISEFDLTKVTETRARTWHVFMTEEKYYGAGGAEDSTVTKKGSQSHQTGFSVGTNNGITVRPYFIEGSGILDRFWPNVGEWQLLENGKKLNITKIPRWPQGGAGGSYTLQYSATEQLPFPYARSLRLEQTETLVGSRKVRKRIILGSN